MVFTHKNIPQDPASEKQCQNFKNCSLPPTPKNNNDLGGTAFQAKKQIGRQIKNEVPVRAYFSSMNTVIQIIQLEINVGVLENMYGHVYGQ